MKKTITMILCFILLASAGTCHAEAETILDTLAGMEWTYCSGAGGWSSDMTIQADGSFVCDYHDSDMGDSADAYPDGTLYFATFRGRMSVAEHTGENTWNIRVDELRKDPGEEQILDGIRYIPAENCGLSEGDIMTLYAPGTPTGALSEDMQLWAWVMYQDQQEVLENWFLGSEANDSGFVGYPAVTIANPWTDMTAEQLEETSGLHFGVPEDAENVVYRYLREEGLAEMLLSRNGDEYCVRARKITLSAADTEIVDISGSYFDWQDEEEFGFGACYGIMGRAPDGDSWVERVLWYDPDQGIQYSLTIHTAEPGSLDLPGVAEKIIGSRTDENE